jgi:hypothetical protein
VVIFGGTCQWDFAAILKNLGLLARFQQVASFLRDARNSAFLRIRSRNPHGEEHGSAVRLEP